MNKILNFLPTFLFIVTIVPCLFLTCYFYIGTAEDAIVRFETTPFQVIGGRILLSLVLLIPIAIICALLECFLIRMQKVKIIPKKLIKKMLIRTSFGLFYVLLLLIFEYLYDGIIV